MIENDELIQVDEKQGLNILTGNKPTRSSNLGEYLQKGGPGRPVGSKNKIPGDLRADIMTVFEQLGGVEGMVAWAKKSNANRGQFYCQILTKILPREITGGLSVDHRHAHLHATLEGMSDAELEQYIQRAQDRASNRTDGSPGQGQ